MGIAGDNRMEKEKYILISIISSDEQEIIASLDELAQLKYRASHVSGLGKMLSRQGGGIGTRGPGETKLESDRRTIRHRMGQLSRQIREMESFRYPDHP